MPLAGRTQVQCVAVWLGGIPGRCLHPCSLASRPLPAEPSLRQLLPPTPSGFVMNSPSWGHTSAHSGFRSGSVRVLNIAFCEEGSASSEQKPGGLLGLVGTSRT